MRRSTTCCWPKYRRPVARYVGNPSARSSSSYHSASVPAANSSTISPGVAAPASTSSCTRRATCFASARRQCTPLPEYDSLSVTSSSTGCPKTGSGNSLEVVSGWIALAERRAEQVVDGGEHLGPRAVVLGERQPLRRSFAAGAEDRDVGVAEAVDRLELVADEEHVLRRPAREQVDQLALQRVRVLELVDHDRAETQLLGLADRARRPRGGRVRGAGGPRSRAPTRAPCLRRTQSANRASSSCSSTRSRRATTASAVGSTRPSASL